MIEHERTGFPDKPARREAWNNAVDSYIRDRQLPAAAGNWGHPRWLETYRSSHATKKKGQLEVLGGYKVDLDRGGQLIHERVDVTTPGDYGADPLGDGKFRMVPSGDIVDFAERTRRLEDRASRSRRAHSTKRSTAQLDREIAEALSRKNKSTSRTHATIKTFDAPKPDMTVRQINAIVRAADGRNVYLIRHRLGEETVQRVTRARTKGRETEVRSLATGNWIPVLPERGDRLEVR